MRAQAWITFDCFGTLVDWNSGFDAIVRPLAGDRTPAVVAAYHRHERALEAGGRHLPYKDVLTSALAKAAAENGVPLTQTGARALPASWGDMPVFPDVEPMLAALREAGYGLAVLTNCDDDLFAETQRAFQRPFDLVVTAERVGSYKPALGHFLFFSRETAARKADWIHVANSWYHDIAPARELGLTRIWLDRDGTGEDPRTASAHVRSGSDVIAAVKRLRPGYSGFDFPVANEGGGDNG